MQSVFNYLVSPKGDRTVGSKEIEGQTLLLNTDLQNHSYTNRVGTILNLPLVGNEELKEGDDVIVHHNVFRRFRDVRGNEKDSKNYLSEDVYTIQAD